MSKLSPPLLAGTIPAFYSDEKGTIISVPFSMNRAVGKSQIKGFSIKVKNVQSGNYLFEISNTDDFNIVDSFYVNFIVSASNLEKLKIGYFYKIQMAYIDKSGQIGYYSTVATTKYTTKPDITINNLQPNLLNSHIYRYQGIYSQEGENKDVTERVFNYRFDLFDSLGNLIETSGTLLHNSSNDIENYESYDEYMITKDFEEGQIYRIQYTVMTINGLTISSPKYRLTQKSSIDAELNASIAAALNYENGYIDINLIGVRDEDGIISPATGAFLLTRSSSDDNYMVWNEVYRFKLAAEVPNKLLWRDFTIEQGKTYKYSLQQYNDNGLYSNRILSNIVYSDFEDAFLYDGDKQLKIKYNPKISTFKRDILESKTDTIGSKHPFIFRNGSVNYHEFAISGLISYLMDEENLFIDNKEIERTTNLVSQNIAAERDFKTRVLSWLTNGEAKLFRSPTEGNFIVRLLNTTLTPDDTLGRMLHTFNSTAYEVAEFNYKNLNEMNFISTVDPEVEQLRWETISFFEKKPDGTIEYKTGKINNRIIYTMRIVDMTPGDVIDLTFTNGKTASIKIGITGSYYVDTGVPIKEVYLNKESTGSMTYSYYSIQSNTFDTISNVEIQEVPIRQFIGETDILKEIEYVYDAAAAEWKRNPKVKIIKIYSLDIEKRPLQNVEDEPEIADPFRMYAIGKWETIEEYNPTRKYQIFKVDKYYDSFVDKYYDNYMPTAEINGALISVDEREYLSYNTLDKIDSLKCGNGAIVNLCGQISNIEYSVEEDQNYNVYLKKAEYEEAFFSLQNYLNSEEEYEIEKEQQLREEVNQTYNAYILELIKALEEERIAKEGG